MTESATSTGTLVWFELPSADTEKARGFYSGLFGWTFESFGGQDYQMTSGGAVYNDPSSTGLMAYFDVEDIDAAAARVQELGGTAGDKQESRASASTFGASTSTATSSGCTRAPRRDAERQRGGNLLAAAHEAMSRSSFVRVLRIGVGLPTRSALLSADEPVDHMSQLQTRVLITQLNLPLGRS